MAFLGLQPKRGGRKSAQGERPTEAPPWVSVVREFVALNWWHYIEQRKRDAPLGLKTQRKRLHNWRCMGCRSINTPNFGNGNIHMMTGADVLIRLLAEQGVRVVFGMPGSHSTAIYDAIGRQESIQTILIRNEQAGAYCADGFARTLGYPGVICTTAGPGATNALSGVAEAWADSVPILLLSGQVNSDRIHEECGQ